MNHKTLAIQIASFVGALGLALPWTLHAQVSVSDDFTQPWDTNSWATFGGACLTAGNGTPAPTGTNSIPACTGLAYYANQVQVGGSLGYLGQSSAPTSGALGVEAPDAAGSGALRLTNGNNTSGKSGFAYGYNQAGAIVSSGTPFDNSAGVNIIFKTVSYRGDGQNGDGADGMGFFLADGAYMPYDVGAFGGSLGYSCSNTNNDATVRLDGTIREYDGLRHGYVGLGLDEYGNFLNAGDNTATGPNQTPGRIGMRGAGSIAWNELFNKFNNPTAWPAGYPTPVGGGTTYYPAANFVGTGSPFNANRAAAVQKVCSTGKVWDYSSSLTNPTAAGSINDYAAFSNSVVVSSILPGKKIAAESATTRVYNSSSSTSATPITYNLKITQNGLLSLSMAYGTGAYIPVIKNQDITASNGLPPATFRFGFTGSTGGSTNIHEVLCFQATPAEVAGTSVGVNQKEATKISTGTQAYLANYYPSSWTGRLTASYIDYTPATSTTAATVTISATSNWDAQCNLTGIASGATNACPTTGQVGPVLAQAPLADGVVSTSPPLNRQMITWSGTGGVGFEWAGSSTATPITSAEQTQLNGGDPAATDTPAYNRLNYLRGDRTNEINTLATGLFRTRDGILGDIIDSSPTWVGPPNSAYTALWVDKIPADSSDSMVENSGTTYSSFLTAQATRLNVVYDGANDGFMHAFRSGRYDSTGNYTTAQNDGQEVLAYMPGLVTQTIHPWNAATSSIDPTQDYSNPSYSHAYFVDASPGTGDLYFNSTWHTWLAGGLGAGGAGFYILDVTNPDSFSEAAAPNIVIGDWTSSTLLCANTTTCGTHLGNTYGTPVIRRLHDGKWAVIFGNGFGSTSGDAGIFIMLVDPTAGTISTANTYYLTTGAGSAASPNGIAFVTPVDIDTDHIVDYVYAGDLQGNVWRFDLTSTSESSWTVTKNTAGTPTPLFTTPAGQPITTRLLVALQPQGTGYSRLMVEFGTGQKFPITNTTGIAYCGTEATTMSSCSGTQYLYGIWDWNMASWNALGSTQLASIAGPNPIISQGTGANLVTQTLTYNSTTQFLDGSSNPICWAGSTTCSGSGTNVDFGWEIALPGTNEQVVFSPVLYQNSFVVNTTIPANNSPTSCLVSTDGGNTIAVSVASGGVVPGFFKNTTDTNATGSQTYGTGTPFMLQAGGQSFLLTQTNAACSGVARPWPTTCSSRGRSPARSATGSSQSPGKTTERYRPSASGTTRLREPSTCRNQRTSSGSSARTTYSCTPARP